MKKIICIDATSKHVPLAIDILLPDNCVLSEGDSFTIKSFGESPEEYIIDKLDLDYGVIYLKLKTRDWIVDSTEGNVIRNKNNFLR